MTPKRGDRIAIERLAASWNYPSTIRFGVGTITGLAGACRELGMKRPLMVTDRGLLALPMIAQALELLREAGLAADVFGDVRGNPVGRNVEDGVAHLRAGRHDGVVAFGGGSALDAGKAIALMHGQTRPLWDFEDREDWWTRVDEAAMVPVVAVPTTSGTGSEVGRASVITDEAAKIKRIIFHPKMLPPIVIADPALTVGLPANITAWVGMDALSHSLEALSSPLFHPMAHGIALEGIRLVKEWLPAACADGTDLVARACMQVASTMGATAFQKGLGAMHAMSHPCGAVLDTHHGLTNAVVMPYVMELNREAVADKTADLARYLGLGSDFDAVLEWVLELRQQVGIADTLAELGVEARHIGQLAAMAVRDPSAATNPIELTQARATMLFERAIAGEHGHR